MADKTIVQKPVTSAELKDIHLYQESNTWSASYVPKDNSGQPIGGLGATRSVSGTLTQDAGMTAWITGVVITAINTQEGT
jgi:hypothetical protein